MEESQKCYDKSKKLVTKATHSMIPFIWHFEKGKSIVTNQINGHQGLGWVGNWIERSIKGTSLGDGLSIINIMIKMGYKTISPVGWRFCAINNRKI